MTALLNNDHGKGGHLVPVSEAVPALREPFGHGGLYGQFPEEESDQFVPMLLHYLGLLYRRKWLILSIAAAFMVVAAFQTLTKTPLYVSAVRLQIEREVNLVGTGNVLPSYSDYEYMQTQLEILNSRNLAERVVSALDLGADEGFLAPRGFSITETVMGLLRSSPTSQNEGGDVTARAERAVGIVLGNRSHETVSDTRLVMLRYSDTNPHRAQRVANAYADAFMAAHVDQRFQSNESAKVFLDDKIVQLKRHVEESERALLSFAQKQQIVAVDVENKTSAAEGNLAAANTELSALRSERIKNEKLWRQAAQAESMNVPQILSDSAIKNLLQQRSELTIEYEQKLKTFKPLYPAMVQLRARRDEVDRQIDYQLGALRESLKAAYEASLAQENEAKVEVAHQKKETLELQKGSVEFNMLKREVNTNRSLYTSLLQRSKEVDLASGTGANRVYLVDGARPGSVPASTWINSLLRALAMGLAVGGAIALVLERLRDKVYSPDDAEKITGLSVLGVIPQVTGVESQLADVRSVLSEANRSLCTALQFASENGLPKTLVITSAGPGEGKSLTALGIARHFANLGRKVLLVDADLRNPSQHVKLGGFDRAIGLSNYLAGACTPPEAMQKTEISSLAFMAAGPTPPNAADLLAGSRFVSLLTIGSEIFDLIVIDGPPLMEIADAQLLSTAASATLFVVGAETSRKSHIRSAIRRLQLSRGFLIGAVLTKYKSQAVGYGYGYGYGYGPSPEPSSLSVSLPGQHQPQLQLPNAHESA
jgi:succinoglycan biosynthesis transport protein ExoP